MTHNRKASTVLLDLDGTLVDTAPDMAAALNELRGERTLPPLPYDEIRPMVSRGAAALVQLGFGTDLADSGKNALHLRYLEMYAEDLCRESRLFPGFTEVLQHLELAGLPWGIVTNKPAWLTLPLLEALGLSGRAACVVSGDTVEKAQTRSDAD